MDRATSGTDQRLGGVSARAFRVAALGSLLLVALLLLGAPMLSSASSASSHRSRSSERAAVVLQRGEASVAPSATGPNRWHELGVAGVVVAIALLAALAAGRMKARRRGATRIRVEQFYVRRRGPPFRLPTLSR
jgi:hypothetical protein